MIEKAVNIKIVRRQLPTEANVLERQREMIVSKLQSVLDKIIIAIICLIGSLLKDYNPEEIAAAAVKLMQEGNKALGLWLKPTVAPDLGNITGAKPRHGSYVY